MVREILIYFEGDRTLKEAFNLFFRNQKDLARSRKIRINPVACGSFTEVEEMFKIARRHKRDTLVLFLRDSEGPLKLNRKSDASQHWMVELMEAWFLTDPQGLQKYFGVRFSAGKIPKRPVEEIPKTDVITILKSASRSCTNPYTTNTKLDHARKLLGLINPQLVRQAAPHCDRLFNTIEKALS